MATTDNIQTPSTSKRWLITGSILLAVGLILVGLYTFQGTNTPVEGNAPADAAWQTATVVSAALFTGAGVVLIIIGILKRRTLARQRSRS
ncbi:hypothetical protein [Mycetocola miduiensis]|uniref:Uncharacterized protein n=1 Tax=Mycetocola miduiensis TaxID=995034 RepID=A0A1I4YC64_9MICO|nr:hypothetical protein [Mycetocola miduiensis]SFN35645.1 hypothetical protein SAMN05216219_0113 [Mycetocola miduiensis]